MAGLVCVLDPKEMGSVLVEHSASGALKETWFSHRDGGDLCCSSAPNSIRSIWTAGPEIDVEERGLGSSLGARVQAEEAEYSKRAS